MSKTISESDIDKLSSLARIRVTAEERASLAKDIESILSYVSELDSVEGLSGERQKENLRNITREDVVTEESGKHTDFILNSAPKSEEGYVVVKKVL